jgi:hypothetical protein
MVPAGLARGATPKEIDAAIKRGTDALKARYGQKGPNGASIQDGIHGIGSTCMAGLAMLEGGVPRSDPTMKLVTEAIRNAAYTQNKTYQTSLCLMFLDRNGDDADIPLIQALAVRLLIGQTPSGGWGYDCTTPVNQNDEQFLRNIKPVKPTNPPKMHPDVEKYAQAIANNRSFAGDDNSNTQFAVIAVWLARKHGVPVESALDQIEKRFLTSQNNAGSWAYPGPPASGAGAIQPANASDSPAMYCAGLIGLSTGIARREERKEKREAAKKPEPPKVAPTPPAGEPTKTSDDPFFNPAPEKKTPEPKKTPPKKALDERDIAMRAAFDGLGRVLAESAQAGRGALLIQNGRNHGHNDLYFFWSLERACVIYGKEKVGDVDWYEAGAQALVTTQRADGMWIGSYLPEVDTSFAILFLCKANLARDLSGKVQNETATEMRSTPGAPDARVNNPSTGGKTEAATAPYVPAGGNEVAVLAAELTRASDADWAKSLKKLRDTKGQGFTEALVMATNRLEGDRLKQAREALAERLTRMTPDTLRAMVKSEEPELRRGAVLAMGQKDDKAFLPDLIDIIRIEDEEIVIRAVRASLKSLSGQDFGPASNANAGERKLAYDAWSNWLSKQKK